MKPIFVPKLAKKANVWHQGLWVPILGFAIWLKILLQPL
jgi:hypothetical protein